MKNNLFKLAGLMISAMLLGACSQLATFENEDLLSNQEAAAKNGFNLTPYGTGGNENAKTYAGNSWEAGCIPGNGTFANNDFYVTTYEHTFDVTAPAKKVFVDVYNTPTKIVYKFRLENTSLKNIEINDVLVLTDTEVLSFTHEVNLSGTWKAGNTINTKVEVFRKNTNGAGGGQYALFNTSYNLVGICTTTTLSEGTTDPICEGADFTLTATVSTSFETLTGGLIQILNSNNDVVASADVTSTVRQVTYDVPTGTAGDYTYSARYVRVDPAFRYQGSVFQTTSIVQVIECSGCDESFSYVDNGDNAAYVFTYIPAEDISEATLVFTFPQADAAAATGLDGWAIDGQTRQKTMNLVACQVYSWTVDLTPKCSGRTANNNVWTDFTVKDVSKKGTLENITESCN